MQGSNRSCTCCADAVVLHCNIGECAVYHTGDFLSSESATVVFTDFACLYPRFD